MRKPLTLIVIVIVLAFGVAPFGFGFWAESRMNALLDKITDSGVIDITVLKINRGWFSSDATLVVELTGDADEAWRKYRKKADAENLNSPSFKVQNRIYHGPFPISMFSGKGFSLMPIIGKIDSKPIDESDKYLFADVDYKVLTTFDVYGAAKTEIIIPEWSGPLEGGKANMDWKGLAGEIGYNANLDIADSNISAPELVINGDDGWLRITGLSMDSRVKKGSHDLSLGDGSFSIASIEMKPVAGKGPPAFNITNALIKVSTYEEGDNINSEMEVGVANLNFSDRKFGPGIFKIALRNLDTESAIKINDEVKQLQKQDIPPDQVGMMLGVKLFALLPTILKKGPELEIQELSLNSDFGRVQGRGKIGFDTSNELALANPLLLPGAIIADAELSVPEEFLIAIEINSINDDVTSAGLDYTKEQVQAMARTRVKQKMASPMAQQFFILKDGIYSFNASYENSQLTVNGAIMSLPGLGAGQ